LLITITNINSYFMKKTFYVFYTKVNFQKMVTVTNGKNGDVIYKDYQTMSYQLKPKDLGELADTIIKSLKKQHFTKLQA